MNNELQIKLESKIELKNDENETLGEWYCHCCTAKNFNVTKCRVCGRSEDWVSGGYPLPLHGYGARIFRASQVSKLIDDVYDTDEAGWTPIHSVAAKGNYGLLVELIKMESEINAVTQNGETPLHLAIYSGSLECTRALVKAGADVNAKTFVEKKQPIHFACERGWSKILHYLLYHGVDVNSKNAVDRTPLHNASLIGRVDICAELLKNGADPNALDAGGWTARQMAELNNHRDTVELLCRAGMSEKMPVMKELPGAPWHGEVWDSIKERQASNKIKYEKEVAQEKKLDDFLEDLRKKRRDRESDPKAAAIEDALAEEKRSHARILKLVGQSKKKIVSDDED